MCGSIQSDERLPDPNPKPRAFSGGVFLRRAPSATPNLRASQVPTALPRPFRTRVRSQRAVHAKPQPRPRKSHPLRMTGSSSVRHRRPAPRQTYPQPSVPDKLSAVLLHLVVARRAKSARAPRRVAVATTDPRSARNHDTRPESDAFRHRSGHAGGSRPFTDHRRVAPSRHAQARRVRRIAEGIDPRCWRVNVVSTLRIAPRFLRVCRRHPRELAHTADPRGNPTLPRCANVG